MQRERDLIHANDADDVTGNPAPFFDCVALANSGAEISDSDRIDAASEGWQSALQTRSDGDFMQGGVI